MGNIFINWSRGIQLYCFICLQSQTHHSFSKVTWSAPFPATLFSKVVTFICNTVAVFCHILLSNLDSPNLLNHFFNLHKNISLWCKILWVLTNVVHISRLEYHTEQFHLSEHLCFICSSPPTPKQNKAKSENH